VVEVLDGALERGQPYLDRSRWPVVVGRTRPVESIIAALR
jgi:hypothetical protein